jgi:Holliday junction DNA helicase RuvA
MIDYIIGTVEAAADGTLTVEANQIGYRMAVSAIALQELSAAKEAVKVYTYLNVTENGIALYGFFDRAERDVFLRLTSVSKVGPKVAQSILSLYTPSQLIALIAARDAKALSKASGVGQKLAENIIVNLKDKFDAIETEAEENTQSVFGDRSPHGEAIEALVALGFDYAYCKQVVDMVDRDGLTSKELIAFALKAIGNKGM